MPLAHIAGTLKMDNISSKNDEILAVTAVLKSKLEKNYRDKTMSTNNAVQSGKRDVKILQVSN